MFSVGSLICSLWSWDLSADLTRRCLTTLSSPTVQKSRTCACPFMHMCWLQEIWPNPAPPGKAASFKFPSCYECFPLAPSFVACEAEICRQTWLDDVWLPYQAQQCKRVEPVHIYIYSQDYIDVQKSPSKKQPLQEHIQRLIAIRLQVATWASQGKCWNRENFHTLPETNVNVAPENVRPLEVWRFRTWKPPFLGAKC